LHPCPCPCPLLLQVKSFTVGMPNSPDIMAAREVARHFGTDHYEYLFTAEEAFAMLPQVLLQPLCWF
jgi:asparagine synthase (glutamine-hydrolysing)